VTHVVNCAAKEVANHWESIGVSYLTLPWLDKENQVIFPQGKGEEDKIFNFIEAAV